MTTRRSPEVWMEWVGKISDKWLCKGCVACGIRLGCVRMRDCGDVRPLVFGQFWPKRLGFALVGYVGFCAFRVIFVF